MARRGINRARMTALVAVVTAFAAIGTGVGADTPDKNAGREFLLRGGSVIDGTGAPAERADVLIRGDRIVAIGKVEPSPGARVIDAAGLIVAPGFIDLHSHSDGPIVKPGTRANRNYLRQGVTTIVTGNCGSGALDTAEYFAAIRREGAGTNVAHLIPQGVVRRAVIGNDDRKATDSELARMVTIVDRQMEAGAWGVSSGLIYVPSRYADTAELSALAAVAARHGGIYASHIRSEGAGLLESIAEAIEVGERSGAPVHISHLKASGKANWGRAEAALSAIEAAREAGQTVTADQYPYIASSTSLGAMVVPDWALRGSNEDFAKLADDPKRGPELRESIREALESRDGGGSIRIARYSPKPARVGKSLAEIAQAEGSTPLDIVLDIQRQGGAGAISFGMSEADVRLIMARPYVATASDGSAFADNGVDRPHPRTFGTFPRKVRYALDDQVIPLETAIRSATGLPASILGLVDRGVIRPGAIADLVVFHPDEFRDAATFDDPVREAPGVRYLFVNGRLAIDEGKFTGVLAGHPLTPASDGPADLILSAGRIWTGDPENSNAEAVASRGEVLVAVGSKAEAMRFAGPRTRVVDVPDGFATPGLIDAHGHLQMLGSAVDQLDLRGSASPQTVAEAVKARIAERPGDGWIGGRNWDQSLWPGGEFPTAEALDAVAPGRPVWLRRVDGHAAWANSEALRKAGVTAETPDPPDGRIIRDEGGHPTGVLIDGAMGLVERVVPDPTEAEVEARLLAAQDACLEVGLTGVHDAGLGPRDIEILRRLDTEGRLKLRVYGMAHPPEGREPEFVAEPPPPARAGGRFELRAIKLFIDGAMGSRGALLFEPYADDPGQSGLQLIPEDRFRRTVEAALRSGWQVATHAIGDKGNALVLDAYAAGRRAVPEASDPRLRIEHAQVIRKSDVERFLDLGVIASMQPSHASTDQRWSDARLGPDTSRAAGAYAWRWFLDAGVPVAFGSDFPVEVPDPTWGLYAAISRLDAEGRPPGGWHPEQIVTMAEALRAFTAGSAFAGFAESRRGVLKVGFDADLSVFDRDLIGASPEEVLKSKATRTIIGGEVVHGPEGDR